ncbi:MAG: hypothetical protein Q7T70_05405 [Polaromonas sp.]|nr:hypothetical protein [Polaromonas sp.]
MFQRLFFTIAVVMLTGCATPEPPAPTPPFRDPAMSLQEGRNTLVNGSTTRAELAERLGPADKVRFDNGFEVWVYRLRERPQQGQPATRSPAELVVLLDPSGVVRKSRIKPAYGP